MYKEMKFINIWWIYIERAFFCFAKGFVCSLTRMLSLLIGLPLMVVFYCLLSMFIHVYCVCGGIMVLLFTFHDNELIALIQCVYIYAGARWKHNDRVYVSQWQGLIVSSYVNWLSHILRHTHYHTTCYHHTRDTSPPVTPFISVSMSDTATCSRQGTQGEARRRKALHRANTRPTNQ